MTPNRWQVGFVAVSLILAAGCPGTDFIDSGNSIVSFEIFAAGDTNLDYDCIQWGFGDMRVRPLDGICAADSVDAGDLCLSNTDCDPLPGQAGGTCEGSEALELVGDFGIEVTPSPLPGNILGGDCTPTTDAGGVCRNLFCTPPDPKDPDPPPVSSICVGVNETTQVRCPETECRFCQNLDVNGNRVPCATEADCVGPLDECSQQVECINPAPIRGAALVPPLRSLTLSAGVYEISEMAVGDSVVYVDVPQPPLDPPGPFFRGCLSVVQVVDAFGDTLRFTVLANEDKVVRFSVDSTALEQNLRLEDDCTDFSTNITSILECDTCDAAP